jgi:hypothetical protein
MKKILLYLFLAMVIAGCKKEIIDDNPTFTAVQVDKGVKFYLEVKNNVGKFDSTRIELTTAGDSVVGVVPVLSNQKSFALSFEPATANVKVGGVVQKSGITINDFSKPITYTYTNAKGESQSFKVIITNFTGLPIFSITTSGPIESKDVYVTGSLDINANGQFEQSVTTIGLNIKGRGNSTWGMPKKPYRLKFNSKQTLLGLQAAKNWVLLANYSDKTLLRNAVAFDIGHQLVADFTPHYRFVELVLNGTYQGSYLLTEQVEVNPGRVAIHEMSTDDESESQITGGYLLEVDQRLDANKYFYINTGIPFTIKSPEDITDKQLAYIHDYVQETERVIFSSNFSDPDSGYAKYINVDSFINWFLVNELLKNNDAAGYSSIFYYKDLNGKLGMGPVWDFDLAGGNYAGSVSNDPTGWWIKNSIWFNRLFQDPTFNARVRLAWERLKPSIPVVWAHIDENADYLNLSQQHNFATWNILNIAIWPNSQVAGSYQGEVGYLKEWLQIRINWIDANL